LKVFENCVNAAEELLIREMIQQSTIGCPGDSQVAKIDCKQCWLQGKILN